MELPSRYSLDNLVEVLSKPSLLLCEANAIGVQLNVKLQQYLDYPDGTNVPERDWDNLIILDGCRYDMYEDLCEIDGELQQCLSAGSESWEFLRENFQGERHHDTVYVTANPHAPKLDPDTFYAVENLLEDEWDPEKQTVFPDDVAQAAIEAYERYPDKRLVVHFMQPHFPFIGEIGEEIDQKGIDFHLEDSDSTDAQVWSKLQYNRVDRGLVWTAYRENLQLVLPHAQRVAESVSGKTVITSDHGNLVGERMRPIPARGYGHPRGLHAPELRCVPWHVLKDSERRSTTSERPVDEDSNTDSEIVQERLESLGYR